MAKQLRVEIIGEAKKLSGELKAASAETESFGTKLGGMGKAAALAGGAAGLAILTEGIKSSIDAALAEQQATAKMDAAFKASGLNANAYAKQIDAAESSGRKLGFTNVDTATSLAKLIIPTKDVGKATADLGVAMDLARFKHIDLTSASQILAQAMTGSQRAVKQLGITIPPVTTAEDALKRAHVDTKTAAGALELAHAKLVDKMRTGNEIIDAVKVKLQGQAQAYAQTAAGGMAQFRAQLDNILARIGDKLLPIMEKLLNWVNANWPTISKVIDTAMTVIGVAIDDVMPVVKMLFDGITAPMKILIDLIKGDWTGAWNAFKAPVVDAWNAIKQITAPAMGAIKSAITTGWNEIKSATTTAWNAIKQAVTTVLNAFKTLFSTEINAYKTVILAGWNAIRTATTSAWNAIRSAVLGVWNALRSAAGSVWRGMQNTIVDAARTASGTARNVWNTAGGAIRGVWNTLRSVASTVWNGIKSIVAGSVSAMEAVLRGLISAINTVVSVFRSAYNTIMSIVNGIKSALGSIPGVGGVGPSTPVAPGQIPGKPNAHTGGFVKYHTGGSASDVFAILQRGEYVIRRAAVAALGTDLLDALNSMGDPGPVAVAGAGVPARFRRGWGGDAVHVHFHGGTFIGARPDDVARDLAPALGRQLNLHNRRSAV